MAMRERSGKASLTALLAVFGALAIIVGVVWLWPSGQTKPDIDAGRQAADQFLAQIRGGQPDQAWQSTTAEFKSAEGRESFSRYVKKHPFLTKPVSFVSVQLVTVQNQPRAEYLYRPGKEAGTIRLLAGLDNDTWRVDRITIE
jgi:hypothetical protein